MAQRTSSGMTTPATSPWRAKTFLLFILTVLLFLAFPAKGLHTHGRSHRHSRVERATHKLVARESDWDLFKSRGQRLHCAMDGDQEAANNAVPVPISRWTEYGDLARYGWDLSKKRKTTDSIAQEVLEPMLPELNIDPDKNERMLITQSYPVTVDGKTYEATRGYYKSLFNRDGGMIVVDDVSSPATEAPDKPMEDIVPLRQWSDVVFLLWQDYTKGTPGVLRHIFQSVVANEQSLSIMRQALGEADDFKNWDKYTPMNTDGRTFRPGSDEYYALLYCPNGRGIGWLLTQHKAQMGLLTVSSITVFGQDGEPMLYFKIDPVEQND